LLLEDLVQGDGLHAREVLVVVDGLGFGDGVFDNGVNPAERDGTVEQAVEHLLSAAQGRMADEDTSEDELAEPGFGDGEMEEDVGIGRRPRGESAVEGVLGFVLLLVDELATDVMLFGQVRDAAAFAAAIQSQFDALAGSQAMRGAGGLSVRGAYNAHDLASGRPRFV
jgi:hypothetical protein